MDRRLIGSLITTLPYVADFIQSAFNGFKPNPPNKLSIGDYINQGMNPKVFQGRQKEVASHQLGDFGGQIYSLELQGKNEEARAKRKELLQIGGQFGDDPGIARQLSEINNMLNSSDDNAMKLMQYMLTNQGHGIAGQMVPQTQSEAPGFVPPFGANSLKIGGKGFDKGALYVDTSNPLANPQLREKFSAERGNPDPYGVKTPEQLATRYPQISPQVREQYQALQNALDTVQQQAKEHPDASRRTEAAKQAVEIVEVMRKLTRGEANMLPQVGLPEEIDPILKKHGLSRYFLKPSSTVNSNGLVSNTMTPERRSDDEMKQAAMGIIYSRELSGREQDELGLRVQGNDITEKVRNGANLAVENISLLNQFKEILKRDAEGVTTTWINPRTGEAEKMPSFQVGQGLEGLGEYVKANFNPFGIMQKMGVGESDPGYLILEKLGKLLSDNYLRAASGMQTNIYEAEAFRKILIDGISSGDKAKLWTSVREAEELMKQDLAKAGRDLQSSPYIPYEARRAFKEVGLNIDPYPTLEEESKKNESKKNLPPPTLPSKLSEKDLDEVEKLWNKAEPFKSMPERTDEEKAAKLKAIQSFMLQEKSK